MSEPHPAPNQDSIQENLKAGMLPPPPPDAEATPGYRPVSGWAVAGLFAAGAFAVVVAVSGVAGLIQRSPIFLPLWFSGLAILGVVLSFLGIREVRQSEGTRSGEKVAQIGLWLSLVTGLGYYSYHFVTAQVLQNQSNNFLMEKEEDSGFFARLKEGGTQVNTAFLLTLPPGQRRLARPEDETEMAKFYDLYGKEGPGLLTQFHENPVIRLFFKDLGKDAEIYPSEVRDWRYEKGTYEIRRRYFIRTREVEATLNVVTLSIEPETAGESRKWFVNFREIEIAYAEHTLAGAGVASLRAHARDWLVKWVEQLNAGEAYSAFADRDHTAWKRLNATGLERDKVRDAVHRTFNSRAEKRLQNLSTFYTPKDFGKWEQVGGKIRIHHRFRCMLSTEGGPIPNLSVDFVAVLETKRAIDPAVYVDPLPSPDWDLISISCVYATKGPQ